MKIAFCGHSQYIHNSKDESKVLEILESRVKNEPCEFFLGEYGGFDSFAYSCAKKFKSTHPDALLIFITPYNDASRLAKYESNRFDLIIYPELEAIPPKYAIIHRNKWIVEQADVIIAYITHNYGGAYKMYQLAKSRKKEIYNIAQGNNEL